MKSVATRYLSPKQVAIMVARKGMGPCLHQLSTILANDFRRWPSFIKTPRVASYAAQGVIELMPVADAHWYSFKYVNGHPQNHLDKLPTVMAFGVLAEVASGRPLLISELTLTTALRTAATSALAARVLANPEPRRMALIGNGAQSEFQALAFHHLLGVSEFHLFDIDTSATRRLQNNLREAGLAAIAYADTASAVSGCDIVATLTADQKRATILTPEMLEPGMHINAIGGDSPGKTELAPEILERSRVFVEYEPQTRIEGDIQQMPADFPVTELWQVLSGRAAGRRTPDEVTVFDSVGFALEDYSALRFLMHLADEQGIDENISLIPELDDPKNLFGLLSMANSPSGIRIGTSATSGDANTHLRPAA